MIMTLVIAALLLGFTTRLVLRTQLRPLLRRAR